MTCKLGFTIINKAAGLLASILEHPDDALQNSDNEEDAARGELITIQCELANNGWDGDRLFLDWVGDERVDEELLDDGRFAKLRRRDLEDVALSVLALLPLMKNLRQLDLRKNTITDDGIKKLVRNADMGKLAVLFVGTQASSVTKKALKKILPHTRIY